MDYKKTLEIVKQMVEDGQVSQETAERYFPELKESEDERIRKAISQCVEDMRGQFEKLYNVHHKDALAWLEKQGEQNFAEMKSAEESLGIDSETYSKIVDECIYGEQKPADTSCLLSWTENEEKMLQHLEGIVKDYWAKAEQGNDEIRIKEASDVSYFLKTIQKSPLCWIECSNGLPNRDGTYLVVTDGRYNDVYDLARYDSIEGWHKASEIIYWMPIPQLNNQSIIEQKPQRMVSAEAKEAMYSKPEWSEEDENMLNLTLGLLSYHRQCRNWLKSLKDRVQPKSQWKPSEEQIEALESATENCAYSEYQDCLRELIEQLKKLREE